MPARGNLCRRAIKTQEPKPGDQRRLHSRKDSHKASKVCIASPILGARVCLPCQVASRST
eukprot:scaffold63313_cov18-Prasinocladus_malaysianus.AAC.1